MGGGGILWELVGGGRWWKVPGETAHAEMALLTAWLHPTIHVPVFRFLLLNFVSLVVGHVFLLAFTAFIW